MALALAGCASAPEAATPTAGVADANGMRLAYEIHGRANGKPLLLIPGTGQNLEAWPEEFIDALTERGFRVIAFDPRDTGHSTHLDAAGPPDWAGMAAAAQTGAQPPLAYTVQDFADDAAALITALGLENAHVVGMSQGGMVGDRKSVV